MARQRSANGASRILGLALLIATTATVGPAGQRDAIAQSAVASPLPSSGSSTSLAIPADHELADLAVTQLADLPAVVPTDTDLAGGMRRLDEAVAGLPAEEWELDALTESLRGDPVRAFEFVRDRIAHDLYPGLLRGAQGTLSARAGNAYDRAALLKALLDGMGLTTRYALTELDRAAAADIVERSLVRPTRPLRDGVDRIVPPGLVARVKARAGRDFALLHGALGERVAALDESLIPAPDLAAEAAHHAWVQVLIDGVWTDLDPTMTDSLPEQPLAAAARTYDDILPIDRHTVTIRVVAESLADGVLYDSLVLERRLDAAAVGGGHQILLYFAPDPQAGGGGFFGGVEAPTSFVPLLSIDVQVEAGSPFSAATGEGGGFSDFGGFGSGATGELTGLRLELSNEGPGLQPEMVTRVLLDRLPPAAREAGAVDPADLSPLTTFDDGTPRALGAVHHLMVSTGSGSLRHQGIEVGDSLYFAATELADPELAATYPPGLVLWPTTVMDQWLPLISERVVVPAVAGEAGRAVVSRPRVYVTSYGPDPSGGPGGFAQTDLALDGVRIVPPGGGPGPAGSALRRMWYGVLQAALEVEMTLPMSAAADVPGRFVAASMSMSEPLSLLGPGLGAVPAAAPKALQRAATEGSLVIVPGDPSRATTWWAVRSDGTTTAVLAANSGTTGLGGVLYMQPSQASMTLGSLAALFPFSRTLTRLYIQSLFKCTGVEYGLLNCIWLLVGPALFTLAVAVSWFLFGLVFGLLVLWYLPSRHR